MFVPLLRLRHLSVGPICFVSAFLGSFVLGDRFSYERRPWGGPLGTYG